MRETIKARPVASVNSRTFVRPTYANGIAPPRRLDNTRVKLDECALRLSDKTGDFMQARRKSDVRPVVLD